MGIEMKEKLLAALQARFPHIEAKLLDRYVTKYIAAVMPEIALRYMLMTTDSITDGEMNFAADGVRQACGRYKMDGCTGYISNLMHMHPSTSLIITVYRGNNIKHRVSRVIFNPQYKKEIMEELKSLTIELRPEHLRELQAKANASIDIDPESLASYILQTRIALQANNGDAYNEKLTRNLHIANQLLALAKEDNGNVYLDEYWEEIDSGRIHGHGLSLQRIPKEVRHAALGKCYRYDFKAASYALMTSLALQIDPTLKTAALQEYVRYRGDIRKRIAKQIGVSEEWMKQIFTAMGFGAALKDNPFNSIRAKLGQEKYHMLLCNTEFMLIKQQLDQITAVILKTLGTGDFELLGRTYTEIDPKHGTKRTKSQKLAWVYQCMESDALNTFVTLLPSSHPAKLLVHDCVYLDKRLPLHIQADIKLALQQRYALLNFEGEAIVPIHASNFIYRHDRVCNAFAHAHASHIAAEEVAAQLHFDATQTRSLISM
jgi:hypothetical protein